MVYLLFIFVCSFVDVRLDMNCSLATIYRMASHLVLWGWARIIYPVATHNVYAVRREAKLSM